MVVSEFTYTKTSEKSSVTFLFNSISHIIMLEHIYTFNAMGWFGLFLGYFVAVVVLRLLLFNLKIYGSVLDVILYIHILQFFFNLPFWYIIIIFDPSMGYQFTPHGHPIVQILYFHHYCYH